MSVPIKIHGREILVSEDEMSNLIKKRLLSSATVISLFDEFEVDPERLSRLVIQITELDQKYAETDAQVMKINRSLFTNGDFFRDYFFVVAHEIVHWLSRVREQDAYFNDPEEVLGFVSSIAYEIEQGQDFDVIWNRIYPKISWHFHNEADARDFFMSMIEKAKKLLEENRGQ